MNSEPKLTAAAAIHFVVCDLLHQKQFGFAHFPELVDIGVIGSGLGVFQNRIELVKAVGGFWDSTYWGAFPRPFLDSSALAYANALTAWVRGDSAPIWSSHMRPDLVRPFKKSLKFLFKTNDSFFNIANSGKSILSQSQQAWLDMAASKSVSNQVVAVRHLEVDDSLQSQQEAMIVGKLMSPDSAVVLNAIAVVEKMKLNCEPVNNELRLLSESRDNETAAKAMNALTRLGELDEPTIELANKMMDNSEKFVSFSGSYALCSLPSVDKVPEQFLPAINRKFIRSLQDCDYEFVSLWAAAFNRWYDDPKTHIEGLLITEGPEFVEVGLEALENAQNQLVNLSSEVA